MSRELRSRNLIAINHEQLKKVIIRHYYKKKSLFIIGAIGIGKSQSVRAASIDIARELGLEFIETKQPNKYPNAFCLVDQRLAQKDAIDLLGCPEIFAILNINNEIESVPIKVLPTFLSIHKDEKISIIDYVTKWSTPSWLPTNPNSRGIIFLDEYNLAPPLVQHASYELINDRRLGDWIEPEGWIAIGAGNRGPEDGAPVFSLPDPLRDRFDWAELKIPSVDEWTEWALSRDPPIDSRIIAYLHTKRSALYSYDPNAKERVFATPRSWERASDLISDITNEADIELYLSTVVGTYIAGEFRDFLQLKRTLPPVEEFIKNPAKIRLPLKRDDLLYALCSNLAEYWSSQMEHKVLEAIVIIAERLTMEYTVFLLKLCKSLNEDKFKRIAKDIKIIEPLTEKIAQYLF